MHVTVHLGRRVYGEEASSHRLELPYGATVSDAIAQLWPIGGCEADAILAVGDEPLGTVARHRPYRLQEADEIFVFLPIRWEETALVR